MNVTVITCEPMDFGVGPDTRVEFVDAKYHIDKENLDPQKGPLLHIQSDREGTTGNIATFRGDEWRTVIRGDVVEHPEHGLDGAAGGRTAPLTVVQPPSRVSGQ